MKCFRLIHLPRGAARGIPVSPFWFLDHAAAKLHQKILLWPHEPLGRLPLPSGEEIPLAELRLRTESVILPATLDPELEWICWKRHGEFGYAPVLPGRCFDPQGWRLPADSDLRDPILAPKIAEAARHLDEALKKMTAPVDWAGPAPGRDNPHF